MFNAETQTFFSNETRPSKIEFETYPDGELKIKNPDRIAFSQIFFMDYQITLEKILIALATLPRESKLYLSYLPYMRQDKEKRLHGETLEFNVAESLINIISEAAFSRRVLVYVYDPHCRELFDKAPTYTPNAVRYVNKVPILPIVFSEGALSSLPSVVLYPDQGAQTRYSVPPIKEMIDEQNFRPLPSVSVVKKREGIHQVSIIDFPKLYTPFTRYKRVFIVDDMIDGGNSILQLLPKIKEYQDIEDIQVYISHIVSRDDFAIKRLLDEGVSRIYYVSNNYYDFSKSSFKDKLTQLPFEQRIPTN